MAAKPPHLKILQHSHHEQTCHSRTSISATFGHNLITFRSSFHTYHILFEILGSKESIASNSARFGFETEKLWPFEDDRANHERKCRTSISLLLDKFLKHYLELKLRIPYLVSNLGKSGVQSFKRCTIWSWNEEVMVVWRQARKAEREFRSRDTIWKGVSQLRNHFLAPECHFQHSSPHFEAAIQLRNHFLEHESHFEAPYTHFAAAKWAAKSILGCEITFELRNGCEMISKLQNGCEITSKLRNGLQIAKLTCEMEGDLQKHFAKPREVAKMPTEPRDHASEEESPEHLEITHTKSLTPLLTSLNHQIP